MRELRQEIPQFREKLVSMVSGAATLVKHKETSDKIRLLRVVMAFLEDKHNP